MRDRVALWWKWALEPVLGYRIMECEAIESQSENWTENQMENQIEDHIENQDENQTENQMENQTTEQSWYCLITLYLTP